MLARRGEIKERGIHLRICVVCRREEIKECTKTHDERKSERDEAQNARKEKWRHTNELETKLKQSSTDREKHEGTLNRAWGRDVHRGIKLGSTFNTCKEVPATLITR